MTNKELIAINQDRMGQAAELIYEQANGIYLFAKDLENGDVAVGVLNMSSAAKSYTVNFSEIPALDASATYSVRDLCAHADLEAATGSMAIDGIAAHETKVYRLSKNDLGSIAAPDVADAVNRMTVADDGESLKVCVPGTEGAAKRLLVSDLNGRVLTATSGSGECFTVARPSGVVVIEVVCAGHAHRVKYIVH